MKFVYKDMGHILAFDDGYVNELVIENKKMFFEMVNNISNQADGLPGNCILSISDKPVEFSRYADLTIQFAPFQLNRKSLITKLCAKLEQNSVLPENYTKSGEMLCELERFIFHLASELPFDINCQKLSMGAIIRALAPEIEESDKSTLEKTFAYMELVRELDRNRLFIMVNMRTYFTDEEMSTFIESVCLHGFNVLLIESVSRELLQNTRRFTVDEDLCEF